ncbi:MAG TPA: hypothetical protein VIO61_00845 [Anaerolineaceae bacterium]
MPVPFSEFRDSAIREISTALDKLNARKETIDSYHHFEYYAELRAVSHVMRKILEDLKSGTYDDYPSFLDLLTKNIEWAMVDDYGWEDALRWMRRIVPWVEQQEHIPPRYLLY